MFRNISWSNYWLFVALIICIYYSVVFVIYYSANIKAFLSTPLGRPGKRSSKTQTLNRNIEPESSNDNLSRLAAEIGSNEEMVEDDLLPVIDSVKRQIKVILQNAVTKNLIKEELLYSIKLLLKNFAFLNNSFFQESINQYVLRESSNLHLINVSEDELTILWSE